MKKNELLIKIRKILASKKILNKTAENKDLIISSVKLWFDRADLRKRLESDLKKEWKIDDIDDDLDFDLDETQVKWHFYVRTYSKQGYGEVVLECPNQKIKVSGKAVYTIEESKVKRLLEDDSPSYRDLEHSFEFEIDATNIEINSLRDFRLENGSIVELDNLEFSNKEWTLWLAK
jgi:flagellar motor switch/type III secretory pathway protein FliN